jgi:hypothetical protein
VRPRLLLAPVLALLLVVNGQVAHAALVRSACGMVAAGPDEVQAPFEGIVYGYAVFDHDGAHTLRCYIKVGSWEVESTPVGAGAEVVVTAGNVLYSRAEGFPVWICTEIDGVTRSCNEVVDSYAPQAVHDVADSVSGILPPVVAAAHSVLCPVLGALAPGVPGVVDIDPSGDTSVLGGYLVDCAPYGDANPSYLPSSDTTYVVQHFIAY